MKLFVSLLAALLVSMVCCQDDNSCSEIGLCQGRHDLCKLVFINATAACTDKCPSGYICQQYTGPVRDHVRERIVAAGINADALHICSPPDTPTACSDDSGCDSGEKCMGRWNTAKSCYPVKENSMLAPCGSATPGQRCTLPCSDSSTSTCDFGICLTRTQGRSNVCLPQCRAFLAINQRRHGGGHAH